MARRGAGKAVTKRGKKTPANSTEITNDVAGKVATPGNGQSEDSRTGADEAVSTNPKLDIEMTDPIVQDKVPTAEHAFADQNSLSMASATQKSIEQATDEQVSVKHHTINQAPTIEQTSAAERDSLDDAEVTTPGRKSGAPSVKVVVPTLTQDTSIQSSPLSEVPSVSPPSQAASASDNDFIEPCRPSRKRRLPTRYNEDTDTTASSPIDSPAKHSNASDMFLATERPRPTRAVRTSSRAAAKDEEMWSEKSLFESPESLLVNADLVKMLQDPGLWDCLSDEDKLELLATFPEDALNGPAEDPKTRLRDEFLKYDNDWKSGVRMFQEDLGAGRYDPEWLRQAQQALEDREHGNFDKFKEKEYEEFWGQKQKMAYDVIAGDSSKMKLETLISNDVFQVGDIWQFCRSFGKGRGKKTGTIVVEKEATITAISADNKLTFTYPPGQFKLSSPNLRKNVQITGIAGPGALETALIKEDGRITHPPNGNAWKAIRCKRNNQDLGALWDMRQFFFIHNNPS